MADEIEVVSEDTTDSGQKIISLDRLAQFWKKFRVGEQYDEDSSKGEIFNDYVNNVASGTYSHVEGFNTKATGFASHAEGAGLVGSMIISGEANATTYTFSYWSGALATHLPIIYNNNFYTIISYDITNKTITLDKTLSTSTITDAIIYTFGNADNTTASGTSSHAEGCHTTASGTYSHAEGHNTRATGESSHAEGIGTTASSDGSHAEGQITTASNTCSHAEGYRTTASGNTSHAEGVGTTASGYYGSHAEGESTTASGWHGSHSEGRNTTASGASSHAEGSNVDTSGNTLADITKEINGTSYTIKGSTAYGISSHAEGVQTFAYGYTSHAEGYQTTTSGDYGSHAEGYGTTASGYYGSHAEGYYATASGTHSHAEGVATKASGNSGSHAEGYETTASGSCSHAEGWATTASGNYGSHAEGSNINSSGNVLADITRTINGTSYTIKGSTAHGISSHAEGVQTFAYEYASHAEGRNTIACGNTSHAEGAYTIASGNYSHAEGYDTTASGGTSHAEGIYTTASNAYSHAEGYDTTASGRYGSHAEGYGTTASGYYGSHAEGSYSKANGISSHAEGTGIGGTFVVSGEANATTYTYSSSPPFSFATNAYIFHNTSSYKITSYNTTNKTITLSSTLSSSAINNLTVYYYDPNLCPVASGNFGSHAEGVGTKATGYYGSHAEGYRTTASGYCSHAEGCGTTASGNYSHAEGYYTTASEAGSHAEGCGTTASGTYSHAEGVSTTASGTYSHAEGFYTTANMNQHVGGHFNTTYTSSVSGTEGTAFIIGNGTSTSARSNAFRIRYDGYTYAKGSYSSSGADYAEFFEWEDLNPNDEDRRGYFVTLNEDKIKIANEDDYILGVISALSSVIGNADEDWRGKFLLDEFGGYIKEEFEYERPNFVEKENEDGVVELIEETIIETGTRFKLNPDYDSSLEYIQRIDRPEWDTVGMLGVLHVRDNGECQVNGYCKCGNGGIAIPAERNYDTYRVIERVNDSVIKIIFK